MSDKYFSALVGSMSRMIVNPDQTRIQIHHHCLGSRWPGAHIWENTSTFLLGGEVSTNVLWGKIWEGEERKKRKMRKKKEKRRTIIGKKLELTGKKMPKGEKSQKGSSKSKFWHPAGWKKKSLSGGEGGVVFGPIERHLHMSDKIKN